MRRKRRPNLIITNRSVLPYNIDGDTMKFKIIYRDDQQQSYVAGISGYVYGNIGVSGATINMGLFVTDKFGQCDFLYNTDLIEDRNINTAKFWASGVHENWGLDVNSCIARADYIYIDQLSGIIITAGTCGDFNDLGTRYDFDEFDGYRITESGLNNITVIERPWI